MLSNPMKLNHLVVMIGEVCEQVRDRAAVVYNSYQKCGLKPAQGLFASGW